MFLTNVDIFKYVDKQNNVLPKWKKDAKEFTVSINFHDVRGYQSSIPKPIIEALGNPEKITFMISGDSIKIIPYKEMSLKEKKRYR